MTRGIAAFVGTCTLVPIALRGIPWLVSFPRDTAMVLFNHEVGFKIHTGTFNFFNPGSVHSFFPFTFVLSREFFLVAPSPTLVEFISPSILMALLLGVTLLVWLKGSNGVGTSMAVLAGGSLILFFLSMDNFLWFRSIGFWEVLAILILLRVPTPGRSQSILFVLLSSAVILGDDGIASYFVLLFLATGFVLRGQGSAILGRKAAILLLMVLGYSLSIGYVGQIYYGTFSSALVKQLLSLLNSGIMLTQHVSLASLPLSQLIAVAVAEVFLFAVIPAYLLKEALKAGLARPIVPAAVVLVLGIMARALSIFVPRFSYASLLSNYLLYLALPLTMIAALPMVIDKGSKPGRTPPSNLKLLLVVGVCILVISTLQAVPIIPSGGITRASDPRVTLSLNQVAGVYIHEFSTSAVSPQYLSDASTLFVGSGTGGDYRLSSLLPSPISLSQNSESQSVVYSDGILVVSS